MIEIFTAVMQLGIAIVLGVVCFGLYRSLQRMRELTAQIIKYRREVDWLTARLDARVGEKPNGQDIRPQAAQAARGSKAS